MNQISLFTGVAGFAVAVLVFFVVVAIAFPWNLRKMTKGLLVSVQPSDGKPALLDAEELVHELLRFRMLMLGLVLVFCFLVAVCSTVMVVTSKAPSAKAAVEETSADSGSEAFVATPSAPAAAAKETLPAKPPEAREAGSESFVAKPTPPVGSPPPK